MNLAREILPLVVTVIPISAFDAQINDSWAILYVLVTDIIFTSPLLVKGIQLLIEIETRLNLQWTTSLSIVRGSHIIFGTYFIGCGYTGSVDLEFALRLQRSEVPPVE